MSGKALRVHTNTNTHTHRSTRAATVPWDLLLSAAQRAGTVEPAKGKATLVASLRVSIWESPGHQCLTLLPGILPPHAVKQPRNNVPSISLSGDLLAKCRQILPWFVTLSSWQFQVLLSCHLLTSHLSIGSWHISLPWIASGLSSSYCYSPACQGKAVMVPWHRV